MNNEEPAGITRMKESQTAENQKGWGNANVVDRPAVYIDVTVAHEDKEFALKGLFYRESQAGADGNVDGDNTETPWDDILLGSVL